MSEQKPLQTIRVKASKSNPKLRTTMFTLIINDRRVGKLDFQDREYKEFVTMLLAAVGDKEGVTLDITEKGFSYVRDPQAISRGQVDGRAMLRTKPALSESDKILLSIFGHKDTTDDYDLDAPSEDAYYDRHTNRNNKVGHIPGWDDDD